MQIGTAGKWLMLGLLSVGLTGAVLGCETSSMDQDLKRQADRATILLDRAQTELQAAKAENERLTAELAKFQKKSSTDITSLKDAQQRIDTLDAQLLQSQQRIRELEDAAMANRQGMPATRATAP